MSGLLEGRIAIVTGAGRGIGRAHALELASHGAKVIVNDYGVSLAGEGTGESPAEEVVALIQERGGEAVTNGADVADFEAAAAMVQQAIDTFGGLDILVNNAGLRPRPDAREHVRGGVGRSHPRPPQGPLRSDAARRGLLADGVEGGSSACRPRRQHLVGAGLQGSVGQATYSAAKAGIAGLTLVAAQEMGRYGVTVNAIAPVARTRMTEGAFDTSAMAVPEDNSPLVAWLASEDAGDVTGRVIEIDGSTITVENGWAHGPARDAGCPLGRRRRRSRTARAAGRGPCARAGLRGLTHDPHDERFTGRPVNLMPGRRTFSRQGCVLLGRAYAAVASMARRMR